MRPRAASPHTRTLRALAYSSALLAASACASRFDVETTPDDPLTPIVTPPLPSAPAEVAPPDAEIYGKRDAGDAARSFDAKPFDAKPFDARFVDARDASDAALRKRMFVTSTTYRGSELSTGLAPGALGADNRCASVALMAGLTGTFKAWISDENTQAFARFPDPGPFYDVARSNVVFAQNPSLALPVGAIPDELGTTTSSPLVWTGSSQSGLRESTCESWATRGVIGTIGNANLPGSWASFSTTSCDNLRHLYCFER